MAKYISAEIAKKALANSNLIPRYAESCKPITDRIIDSLTAADVEPVRHGRLLRTGIDEYYGEFAECSVCGWDNMANAKYCSGCGAKMDLEGVN